MAKENEKPCPDGVLMEGDCPEPAPELWKVRLLEERRELLARTIKLKKALDNPEMKLSNREWEMLRAQFCFMRDYLQALTDRCVYYGLIESGDLGIHY